MPPALNSDSRAAAGPDPRRAARREMVRAFGGLATLPFHFGDYLLNLRVHKEATATDLAALPEPPTAPLLTRLPQRPLRIFVSCAEASGELHGTGLARELTRACAELGAPAPELLGLGGPDLAASGVRTLADPGARAAMGVSSVLAQLPFYEGLLRAAATAFRDERPDVFVPVDSPALHVPMARIAARYGVPTVHYIAPQFWGWAPWRVAAYRRTVERVLTILPFEGAWFERHGVPCAYVGHPLLDVHARLAPPPPTSERRGLVLLPGSRRGVIERNLPWMLRAIEPLVRQTPDLRASGAVVIAQSDTRHAELARTIVDAHPLRAEVVTGDLHAVLGRSRAALAVSGTVLLDVLHHRLPTVVVYRIDSALKVRSKNMLLTTPWFASVNLLAGSEVWPEFCFQGDGPLDEVAQLLSRSYSDDAWRAARRADLERAARRLGPPGAGARAARHALQVAARTAGRANP
ncbi:MAG: hypothetical protein GY711_17050 [bacterium]|nr:hypothetical protein [bacterium]